MFQDRTINHARLSINFFILVIMLMSLTFGGVQVTAAQGTGPNYTVVGWPDLNAVEANDWFPGRTAILTIDDPNTGSAVDYTDQCIVGPSPDLNVDGCWFDLGSFDLKVGDTVTVDDGVVTKVLVIRSLAVSGFDLNAELLTGTALGSEGMYVDVSIWGSGGVSRRVQIDQNSNWAADFSVPGGGTNEQTTYDLQLGTRGAVELYDGNGNSTGVEWEIPNPTILARANEDLIEGNDWVLGSSVTIEIDDPFTAPNPDETVYATVGTAPWNSNQPWFEISLDNYDLKAGDVVTATDGSITKQLTIKNILITSVDVAGELVYGNADPGQLVYVQACNESSCANRDETADQDGNWVANFAIPGEQNWEQDTADLRGGMWIDANINDGDGDMSRFGMSIPNPSFIARLSLNQVDLEEWPMGDQVYLMIDDPNTGASPDYGDSIIIDNNSPVFEFGGVYSLKIGDEVTVYDDNVTKTTTVANVVITSVDIDNDVISGTADPGIARVWVRNWSSSDFASRWVDVTDGLWSADFSVPGAPNDGTPAIYDIKSGDEGVVRIFDNDGDSTTVYWYVPNPTFSARLTENEVHGYEWPLNASVTLTIDDPSTPQTVDYNDMQTVVVADWNPNQTFVQFQLWVDNFTLSPGMTLTMNDGETSRSHTVIDLTVDPIDPEADAISGQGNPDQDLWIDIWCDDGCSSRHVVADSNGDWLADFSVPGDEGWENNTFDIRFGDTGEVRQQDEQGNTTNIQWTVDWVAPPSIPLVFSISNPVDLNVPRATVENISVLNTLNDSLFRIDQNGSLQPLAATNHAVSGDGLVYTVYLRPGAVWSDGVPVTAQHYVDGILRVLDPNVGSDYGFIFYPIQNAEAFNKGDITDPALVGVKALNASTIEFTLEQPTSHFPLILASPAALPARQDVIDQYGNDWTSPAHYVGNGLYRLMEYDNAHIVIEQNPLYDGPVTASFSQIAFDVIPDLAQQIGSYKNGYVDVLLSTPINTIMSDPALRSDLIVMPSPGLQYIGFTSQVFPTNDPLVRKALASAIDRQILIDDILMTPWRVEATGVIPPELPGYQGSAVGYSYDPTQAQSFLAQAGYPGGVGFPGLNLIAVPGNAAILEEIASQWETVLGITVNIQYVSPGERFGILLDCRANPAGCAYNGFMWGWAVDYPDAYNFLNDLFHPDGPYNFTQWDNSSYRNLIELAVSELDPVQRLSYLQQAQQILVQDDAAIAPLFHIDGALVVRPGIFPYYSPSFFTNLAYWSNSDPANDGMSAAVIGSGGGTISTDSNTVSVLVPAGALQDETTLSVTDLGGNYQITASQEELNVITGYSIQPHGLQFDIPVTLTFAWNDTNNDGLVDGTAQLESNIYLRKDGQAISPACGVNPNCDMTANILTVEVTSLSRFELVVPANQPPANVVVSAPIDPVNIADFVSVNVEFDDPGDTNPHNVKIEWGDSTATNISVTGSTAGGVHQYQSAGVYTINVTVTDSNGQSAQATFQYVVVYDPDGGFVTGGGWIWSPEGAYYAIPSLTGKATFGFVSKYQKGASIPTGNTEFQFKVANLNFKSTSYDWLVIAGTKAQYKGTGTINGTGEYKFMLSAIDGSPDKFRIKIWDKATGDVVYDNQLGATETADPATTIQGGSIVVHKAK